MTSKFSKPTLEDWRMIFQEAAEFKAKKPWEYFSDTQMIAIEDPLAQITCYCSIYGAAGQLFGVGAHIGRNGLAGFLDISEQQVDHQDIIIVQDCFMVSFEDKDYLSQDDLDLIKQLGLKFRGKNNYPQIVRHEPGFKAELIQTQAEVQLFGRILKQLNAAIDAVNSKIISPTSVIFESKMLHWFCENGLWRGEIRPFGLKDRPERALFEISPLKIDEFTLHRYKKNKPSKDSIELDFFVSPASVDEPGKRAYYPFMFFAIDQKTGKVLGLELAQKKENFSETFKSLIVNSINKSGLNPKEYIVTKKQLAEALKPFCETLGIKIKEVEWLEKLEPIKMALFAEMTGNLPF